MATLQPGLLALCAVRVARTILMVTRPPYPTNRFTLVMRGPGAAHFFVHSNLSQKTGKTSAHKKAPQVLQHPRGASPQNPLAKGPIMATCSPRYRRPWRPASQLPPTPAQIKQVRQLYLSDAFTQQERDDLAEWLASGEATRQSVSSAIGRANTRKEAPRQGYPAACCRRGEPTPT